MDNLDLLDDVIALSKKLKLTMSLLTDLSARVSRVENELIRNGFKITRPLDLPDTLDTAPLPKPPTERTDIPQ